MAENSAISWTNHTFNPWIGCTKISAGCKNCYAESLNNRMGWAQWGADGTRKKTSAANWKKPLTWNKRAEKKGVTEKVFCASLGDVFEDRQDTNNMLFDLGLLITATHNLEWLLLTKRPENVMRLIQDYMGGEIAELWLSGRKNIWIGASVEDQEQAEKRIPELLQIPAAKTFLSIEPLLGPIDLSNILSVDSDLAIKISDRGQYPVDRLDWLITGGESGKNARPVNPKWVRSLRDQCLDMHLPFHFKQWGEWAPDCLCNTKKAHREIDRPGGGGVMFRCGKKAAGRLIDGVEWNQFPGTGL